MISLADKKTTPYVRNMWKICFDDEEAFMDLYFSRVYKPENTLVYFEENIPVASLQMLPYSINFYGQKIPFSYISGACTLPEFRKKGYMEKLLLHAFEIMQKRKIPLSILIPAEEWLYGFYGKYGYEKVFEEDNQPIPLQEILTDYEFPNEAYQAFNEIYKEKDFCVQKTKEDFITIMEDYKLSGCPEKTNLSGMARMIDIEFLLSAFAKTYTGERFSVSIEDSILSNNNRTFCIEKGNCKEIDCKSTATKIDIQTFTSLLFGTHLHKISNALKKHFQEHHPILNLMLE